MSTAPNLSSPLRAARALAAITLPLCLTACYDHDDNGPPALSGTMAGSTQRILDATTASTKPAVALLGDIDGDGLREVAIGDPTANAGAGKVTVLSGGTTVTLHSIDGAAATERGLGTSLVGVGDVDGDDTPDLLAGAPGDAAASIPGTALLISGRTGRALQRLEGAGVPAAFGAAACRSSDLNGDGRDDVLVAETRAPGEPARVYAFSGANGARVWTREVVPSGAGGTGANALVPIHDLDNDGLDDVLVPVSGPSALVLSARSGSVLRNHAPDAASAAALADINGDGKRDYALGFPTRNSQRGQVELISGADGAVLRTLNGDRTDQRLGLSLAPSVDRDNDGQGDVLVGGIGTARLFSTKTGQVLAEFADRAQPQAEHRVTALGDVDNDGKPDYALSVGGKTSVYSAVTRGLSANTLQVSAVNGTTQELALRAGASHAGRRYQILGSASGIWPGLPMGNGLRLPLNRDHYTDHTFLPTPPIHINYVGRLDAQGNADARFVVPGGQPQLIGSILWHAYVVYGDAGPVYVSNAVPAQFVQ